jgi:hypothetical protein
MIRNQIMDHLHFFSIFHWLCDHCEVSTYLQEVAVKKFLDQDFYGDALDEFRSEVGESICFFCLRAVLTT